ncbi:hypothetical protein QEH59_08355 [Coraliomargarita sp. SDUM461004]|uniref:Uncharacterized protein n=1 Tax=Thalassobacterium sedimentorum TaxID=3041258 RepID=A0ABU1AHZ8_9BACT|nr:hypothetical protein [Coraliomargarita sp. SDUM461004]MDQ8194435.1 hypothetical protein [Coraliomargarita sp. SDUM461004]
MDNLLEYIIPVIFAAIYFFGNMLSKNADEDEAAPLPGQRRGELDPEVAERQRRIQEEIRRKILQRRQEGQEGQGTGEPQAAERAPQTRMSEPLRRSQPTPVERPYQPSKQERQRQSEPETPIYQAPSPAQSSGEYDIQAKLEQIEATKRRAEKLKKQARASDAKALPHRRPSAATGSRRALRGPVRRVLRDPAAARAAFIYGEVLGPPVTQRKSPSVPGLA